MNKTKVGVIGVGHLGRHHARNYASIEQAEFIGIFDSRPENAAETAQQFQTRAFATLDEILDAADAVSVATPTQTHFEIVRRALEMKCHVLVEKPMTVTVEEGQDLIDLAAQAGRVLQVGHIERFNGAILAIKDRIRRPLFIESHRLAPFNPRGTDVSVILDLMIHDLDIILGFVQQPLSHIHAVGVPVISNSIDIANVRLEFANGCVANVTTSRVSAKVTRKIRFFQKDCYFSIDMHKRVVDIFAKNPKLDELIQKDISGYTRLKGDFRPEELLKQLVAHEHIDASTEEPLRAELVSFLTAIQSGQAPVVGGREGLAALQLAYQIIDLIESNRKLHLLD